MFSRGLTSHLKGTAAAATGAAWSEAVKRDYKTMSSSNTVPKHKTRNHRMPPRTFVTRCAAK